MSYPDSKSAAPETSAEAASKPLVMIPVMAEDVAREKRRRLLKWLAGALIALLIAAIIYKRVTDPRDARDAFDAGMRLMKSTRYDQAILNFNRAVELAPDYTEAYRMRGRAYVQQSDDLRAIRDFSRVAELQPRDAGILIERGFVHLDQKDYTAAVVDADRALALDPKLARAYNLRASARRATGDLRRALEDFTQAVALEPNLDNYFQRASTYQKLGEHKSAVADFDKALAEDPQEPHIYYARAQSRAALGDSAGAQADLLAGRKIDGF
ncbi:MAG: tetratricopeptide repeat protein [Acidobacteriota bacterium]|nr:tetratricopeptide repeat protein [Acidobacteriota bacterium]